MIMLGSMLLACALAQDAPHAKAPDAAPFEELIRKTNDLHSFRVEYELRRPTDQEPKHVRMIYKSPGTGRIDLAGQTVFRIQDGLLDFRSTGADGKGIYGHFDAEGLVQNRLKSLADSMRTEFVELSELLPSLDVSGLRFDMAVVEPSEAGGKTVDIKLGFALVGEPLLGWLNSLERMESHRLEDNDKLELKHPGGAKLVLSTRTGFLESVEKRKKDGLFTLTLVDLDCDGKLDTHAFDLPEPTADAVDASTQLDEQMQTAETSAQRTWILSKVADLVSGKKLELNADRKTRLGKVFDGMYGDALVLEDASVINMMRQKIENLSAGVRKAIAQIGKADENSRAELDRSIEEQRGKLAESIGTERKTFESRLTIGESVVADAALRTSLGEIEEKAATAAFERVVNDALLGYFDEQVQRAKSGG